MKHHTAEARQKAARKRKGRYETKRKAKRFVAKKAELSQKDVQLFVLKEVASSSKVQPVASSSKVQLVVSSSKVQPVASSSKVQPVASSPIRLLTQE